MKTYEFFMAEGDAEMGSYEAATMLEAFQALCADQKLDAKELEEAGMVYREKGSTALKSVFEN